MKRLLFLLLSWATALAAQNGTEKILVTDLTRIKQPGSIAVAPDGRSAIFTLRSIEANDDNPLEYDYRTHLYWTDFVQTKALTRGSESISSPAWAPNSQAVAFTRNVRGKSQVFVLPLGGGEAYALTSLPYGATNPQWSPDGKWIAFEANVGLADLLRDSLLNPGRRPPRWSLEKPGFADNGFIQPTKGIQPNPNGTLAEIRAYLAKNEGDKKAKVINRLNFQGEATTQPELTFNQVYLIAAQEGAKPQAVARGFYNYSGLRWHANGQLVLVRQRDTLAHPDREQDEAVLLLDPLRGQWSTLLAETGYSFSNALFSPDGRYLAYQRSPSQGVHVGRWYLADATGRNARPIELDRAIGAARWSRDGKYLYFTAPSNGGQPLYRVEAATLKLEQLTDFNSGILSYDLSGTQLVLAKTEVKNPAELYVADLNGQNQRQLTQWHGWLQSKAISIPEKNTFTNALGQTVEYWIMRPIRTVGGQKYPLLVNMHGGPTAMWGPGEFSMWHEFQYFCAQGYGIVYCNPRGSGGYGEAFQRANIKDWGTGPAEDVLTAATRAAQQPWVDTARQVLTGGSYAGYLTAWIVAHDRRFKAAFAQRGVYDLTTFMGEGNAWRLVPNYFNYPWADAAEKTLPANSPYTFVENIRTPLLIKHGENDLRTGVIQSEMLYKSLKILDRPVEYVRMPGATHELSRSGNVRQRIDRMLRIFEFFERYTHQNP